ncbi:unnamed protein product [Rhodiola kirilowii]
MRPAINVAEWRSAPLRRLICEGRFCLGGISYWKLQIDCSAVRMYPNPLRPKRFCILIFITTASHDLIKPKTVDGT